MGPGGSNPSPTALNPSCMYETGFFFENNPLLPSSIQITEPRRSPRRG